MTFNPWSALLSVVFMILLLRFIRQEVRHAIVDYANRLKARRPAPPHTPYDDFCEDLRKDLG